CCVEAAGHVAVGRPDLVVVGGAVAAEELVVWLLIELGVLLLDPASDGLPARFVVDGHQPLTAGALAETSSRRSGAPSTWMRAWVSMSVFTSRARTFRMPSVSTVKVTSISASPRGRGGMPASVRVPSMAFAAKRRDSPWHTWITTSVWLSCEVTKLRTRSTGIGVFLSTMASA